MTEKNTPWYDRTHDELINPDINTPKSKHLFDVTLDEIKQCWTILNEIDVDGLRLNASYIHKRSFVVGVFPEAYDYSTYDSTIDDFIAAFCDKVPEGTELFFMPSSDFVKPMSLEDYEAVKYFAPPAIAKGQSEPQTFASVWCSIVKDYTGSFYCFNRELDFILLFVNGYYCMVAGERDFVEDCVGQDYKASWQLIIEGDMDEFKLPSLTKGLTEYRII